MWIKKIYCFSLVISKPIEVDIVIINLLYKIHLKIYMKKKYFHCIIPESTCLLRCFIRSLEFLALKSEHWIIIIDLKQKQKQIPLPGVGSIPEFRSAGILDTFVQWKEIDGDRKMDKWLTLINSSVIKMLIEPHPP